MFSTLLARSTRLWYTSEVTYAERQRLRSPGYVGRLLAALKERFEPNRGLVAKEYTIRRLTINDIAKNNNAISTFFIKQLRLTKVISILQNDLSN